MANIPSNLNATLVSGSSSITGSYGGFTVAITAVFTGLKDGAGNSIVGSGLTISGGTTVPLFVTSASISSGAVFFYP